MRQFLSIMIFAFGLCSPVFADSAPNPDLDALRAKAEQGDVAAQNQLGAIYSDGTGVPRDDAEALKWYRKAAEQGDAAAQSSLGFIYENGLGTPRDDAELVKWYRKAAEQGDASSQSILGTM